MPEETGHFPASSLFPVSSSNRLSDLHPVLRRLCFRLVGVVELSNSSHQIVKHGAARTGYIFRE